MTIPALLVDFPKHTCHDYATKSALLGRQWSICYNAGHHFFRYISTLGALGYAFTSYCAFTSNNKFDWRVFAVAALAHFAVIVHSAALMNPVNVKILALSKEARVGKEVSGAGASVGEGKLGAEELLRKLGKLNYGRMIGPSVAGTIAMWQVMSALL